MNEKKETATRVIDGRLYVQGSDGLYSAVPRGMDDARDMKARPAARYAVNPADDEAYMVVDDLRRYVHGIEQGGAAITRVAVHDLTGGRPDEPLRLVGNDGPNVCVLGGQGPAFIKKGGSIDTTDPERPAAMRDVPDGSTVEVLQSYQKAAVPGEDGRLTERDLRYMSCAPGSKFAVDGGSRVVSEGVSVPVRVLFNENSSTGEVQTLCSAEVPLDGCVPYALEMGDNYIMGHEDLFETAAFRTPVDPWVEDEHARDSAYAAAYAPKKLSSLDKMRGMARDIDARESERSAGREVGDDGPDA